MGRNRETVRVLTDLDSFAGRKFESFPYQINLVPFAVLKNRKKTFWLQMIAACVLALMLAAYPVAKIAGKRRHLTRIDAKIASLRNEASKMSGLRGENAAITQYLQQLAQEVESHVDMAEILKEVTEILPQDAWLNTMLFSNGRLEIRGTAKSATVVIEALENSPLFKEARFDSPVTSRGDNELFTIVAALE
jgi:general secretion pathway protein L